MDLRQRITAVPALRSPRESLKFRIRVIWIMFAVVALMSFLALLRAGTAGQGAAEAPKPVGVAIAYTETLAWLRGTEQPTLPRLSLTASSSTGYGITRDGDLGPLFIEYSGSRPLEASAAPGWVHRFFVLPQSQHTAPPFYVEVTVTGTTEEEAALAGPPVFTPYTPPTAGRPLALTYSFASAALPEVAVARITTWANAFYGGEVSALAEVSGRPVSEVVPLPGMKPTEAPRIVDTVQVRPNLYIVRVDVRVALASDPANFTTSQVMDLVVDTSGTSPLVVAWGPVGTGPSLVP